MFLCLSANEIVGEFVGSARALRFQTFYFIQRQNRGSHQVCDGFVQLCSYDERFPQIVQERSCSGSHLVFCRKWFKKIPFAVELLMIARMKSECFQRNQSKKVSELKLLNDL